jgi:hypothetical protein
MVFGRPFHHFQSLQSNMPQELISELAFQVFFIYVDVCWWSISAWGQTVPLTEK